jgi:hypothetical protein
MGSCAAVASKAGVGDFLVETSAAGSLKMLASFLFVWFPGNFRSSISESTSQRRLAPFGR